MLAAFFRFKIYVRLRNLHKRKPSSIEYSSQSINHIKSPSQPPSSDRPSPLHSRSSFLDWSKTLPLPQKYVRRRRRPYAPFNLTPPPKVRPSSRRAAHRTATHPTIVYHPTDLFSSIAFATPDHLQLPVIPPDSKMGRRGGEEAGRRGQSKPRRGTGPHRDRHIRAEPSGAGEHQGGEHRHPRSRRRR